MSDDKKGLFSILSKESKWSYGALLALCAGVLFLGYMVGEHSALKHRDAMLEKMIKTNTLTFLNNIPLGLTKEKREEILEAMENAKRSER